MSYPDILSEDETLDRMLAGQSIARFGDGEWRCAVGGGCTSQRPDQALAFELQVVLRSPLKGLMVGIPNPFNGCPRQESWIRYTQPQYTNLLGAKQYASSFITRPDNAPWIDRPDYWEKVRKLWAGQNVVLVAGDKKSITPEMIHRDLKSGAVVIGPRQHAYAEIDRIESDVMNVLAELKYQEPKPRVLLCLGTAATVLAWRLARRGIHALDVGHIGMFMRHAGAYRYAQDDVTSPAYRGQLETLHRTRTWGADGGKHTEAVRQIIDEYQPKTILDYGCGENKLAESLTPIRVSGYDPGVRERATMPKPCDLVISTDVLEHVEPDKLDAVLDHIWRLTGVVGYFVISTRLANAKLPDGRNAHLSVHDGSWWLEKLAAIGWTVKRHTIGKDLTVVVEKS